MKDKKRNKKPCDNISYYFAKTLLNWEKGMTKLFFFCSYIVYMHNNKEQCKFMMLVSFPEWCDSSDIHSLLAYLPVICKRASKQEDKRAGKRNKMISARTKYTILRHKVQERNCTYKNLLRFVLLPLSTSLHVLMFFSKKNY